MDKKKPKRSGLSESRQFASKAYKFLESERDNWGHEVGFTESLIAFERAIEFIGELQSISKWEKEIDLEGVELVAA